MAFAQAPFHITGQSIQPTPPVSFAALSVVSTFSHDALFQEALVNESLFQEAQFQEAEFHEAEFHEAEFQEALFHPLPLVPHNALARTPPTA